MIGPFMKKAVPKEVAATEDEIVAAIEALTTADHLRLRSYALHRAGMLRRTGLDKGDSDLLQIAIEHTLSGRRHWNKESSSFVDYLLGAIKSISNNWCRTLEQHGHFLESDMTTVSEDGRATEPLSEVPSPRPNPEEALVIKEQEEMIRRELDRIEQLVADRPLAALIISERRRGTPRTEIQEVFNLSHTQYETLTRWIYETVRKDAAKERQRGE
jgi:hypothetical protein